MELQLQDLDEKWALTSCGQSAKNAAKCGKNQTPPIIRELVVRIRIRKMWEIRPTASGTGRNRPQDQDPRSTFTQKCVKSPRPSWTGMNMYSLSNQVMS